jgi:adenylate cyclase
MEIEKRYELKGDIPIDKIISKKYIEQVYSNINPDVRIRKIEQDENVQYFHTVKYKTEDKNSRIEIEQNISKEDYIKIFQLINKNPVRKNRYIIPIDDCLIAEVDEFLDINKIIIEVEFESEEQMNEFSKSIKPNWFGDEIVGKQSFSVQVFSQLNNKINVKFY